MGFWFTLGLFAASFIISYLLRPKPEFENAKPAKFGADNFPTTTEGKPVPLLWGTDRVKGLNVVWLGPVVASAISDQVKTGIFDEEIVTLGYNYGASVQLGVCLAPTIGNTVAKVKKFFVNEKEVFELKQLDFAPGDINLANNQITLIGHGLSFGSTGPYKFSSTGTDPGGLVDGNFYFLHGFFDDFFVTAAFDSQTVLDITSIGTGTHSFDPFLDPVSDPDPFTFQVVEPNFWGGEGAGGGIGQFNPKPFPQDPQISNTGRVYVHRGTFPQVTNEILELLLPGSPGFPGTVVPDYNGMVYILLLDFAFGEAPQPPPMSVEVEILPDALGNPEVGGVLGPEANPAEVIFNILADPWGRLNFPTGRIDVPSFQAVAATLDTEDHGFSMTLYNANSASDVIEEILKQIDGIMYEDPATQKIKLVLIREDYTPAALPLFDESNILDVENFKTSTWNETFNQVRIAFIDGRSKGYTVRTAFAQDMANFNSQGQKIRAVELNFPGVRNGGLASRLAGRELKALSVPQSTVTIIANREAIDLRPGSVFRWTWPEYTFTDVVLRVQRIDSGELDDGRIKLECAVDQFDTQISPYAVTIGEFGDELAPGGDAPPSPFEIPYLMGIKATQTVAEVSSADDTTVMYNAKQPDTDTTNFKPDVSIDGGDTFGKDTKAITSQSMEFTESADVSTEYAFTTDPFDQTTGLVVKNVSNEAVLVTATEAEILAEQKNIIRITQLDVADEIEEFLSYQSFTDLGGGLFKLNNVSRGLFDTTPLQHLVNSQIFFIGPSSFTQVGRRAYNGESEICVRAITNTGLKEINSRDATEVVKTLKQRSQRPGRSVDILVDGLRDHIEYLENEVLVDFKRRQRTALTLIRGDKADETPETDTINEIQARINADRNQVNIDTLLTPTTTLSELVSLDGGVAWGDGRVEVESVRTFDNERGVGNILRTFRRPGVPGNIRFYRQLLVNPSFDDATDFRGWTTVSGSPITSTSGTFGDVGKKATAAAPGTDIELSQIVPLIGLDMNGHEARCEFNMVGLNVLDDDVEVIVESLDSGLSVVDTATSGAIIPNSVTEWQREVVTLSNISDDAESIRVRVLMSLNGVPGVEVDALDLRVGDFSAQLLSNVDFETGDVTSWTEISGTWRVLGSTSGTDPLADSNMLIGPVSLVSTHEIQQDASLPAFNQPGDTIWLRWWQANIAADDEGHVILEARDGGGVLTSVATTAEEITPEDTWARRDLFLKVPTGTTTIRVRVITTLQSAANHDVAFDNFQLLIFDSRVNYPTNRIHFTDWMQSFDTTIFSPNSIWRFDQQSGNVTDDGPDGEDLVPTNSPTQGTAIQDLATRAAVLAVGTSEHFLASGSTIHDIGSSDSLALLFVGKVGALTAGTIIRKLSGGVGYELRLATGGVLEFEVDDGTITHTETISGVVATDVIRVLCVFDRNADNMQMFSTTHGDSTGQVITVDDPSNAGTFLVGGDSLNAADMDIAQVAVWVGTVAEGLTDTQLDLLVTVMDDD